MDGATIISRSTVTIVNDLDWKMVGSGDYNGDLKADILWHHDVSGQVKQWQMNGATIASGGSVGLVNNLAWQIVNVD